MKVRYNCLGVSLLEILISLLVLAIGILGLTSLQINALRHNQDAHQRSIALNQMTEFADRMRANPQGVSNGSYDSLSGKPSLPNCSPCNPAQIASRDLSIWNTENAILLPNGQGRINKVSANLFDVTLMWDSHRTGATGTNCSKDFNKDLTCITTRVKL